MFLQRGCRFIMKGLTRESCPAPTVSGFVRSVSGDTGLMSEILFWLTWVIP